MSNKDHLTWADGRSSSPVSIPQSSNDSAADLHRVTVAKSAPNRRRGIDLSTRSGLIDPVVEESEVLISSGVRSDAGLMQNKRRVAELGDLSSARHYGTVYRASYGGGGGGPDGEEGGGESLVIPHELEQSSEALLEEYVKIAARNKRAEHATTYANAISDVPGYYVFPRLNISSCVTMGYSR